MTAANPVEDAHASASTPECYANPKASSPLIESHGKLGRIKRVNYFGTVRGRVGYSFDRTLVYLTGGLAFADIDQREDSMPPPDRLANGAVPVFREKNGIRAGYVVGGGLEYKFNPSWSLKGEYQYLNLGSDPLNGVVPDTPVTLTTSDIANTFHTIRVGLNYHF